MRRSAVHVGVGAALAACIAAGRLAAQDQGAPSDIALSGELELSRLVEFVSQRLGVSVQYQAPDLAKKVTLRLRTPLADAELWDALTTTLDGQGLAIVQSEQEGLYRVVPVAQAAAQDGRVLMPDEVDALRAAPPDELAASRVEASQLSAIVRLRSAEASDVVAALTPILTPQTGVAKPIGAGGLLFLSDSRRRVEQALALLDLLDGPADPARVFTLELAEASAAEVIALTQQALAAKSAVEGRSPQPVQRSFSPGGVPPGAPVGGAIPGGGVSGGGGAPQLIALPDDQRIMAVVPASREQEIRDLIAAFDRRDAGLTHSYSTVNASPEDLAASIKALLDSRAGGGATGTKGPRVYADRLTGAVVVTASSKDQERVAELVDRVNAAPAASRQTLRSFVIRSRSAKELVTTLEALLASGALDTDVGGVDSESQRSAAGASTLAPNRTGLSNSGVFTVPTGEAGSGVVGSPSGPGGPSRTPGASDASNGSGGEAREIRGSGRRFDLSLSVDDATNSILAVGDPSALRQLEALIADLDRRQPQVMIEATIVSLSESDAINFGVELSGQFNVGGSSVNLASLFGLATPPASGGGGPLASGTGFTGLVINPGDFQVVVRALENINRGRAVSSPKALVNNNATATLRGVVRQPFTSINASQTVATTSFGGTQDAGTTITVTPAIAAGDHLLLDYAVELSAFTGEPTTTAGGGIIPPPSQQNSVEGQATIPDGFTIVIGGLDNASRSKGSSRVPILGSIPILGALFGTQSETESDSRFFVFLRATILRDAGFEDLKRLSAPGLAAAGITDGMPRLEPLWVE